MIKESIGEKQEKKLSVSGCYDTVEEWKEVLDKWNKGVPVKGYDRYNYPDLIKREKAVAELVGVEPGKLLMYNSGMSAIVEALESFSLQKGDVLLYSSAIYGESKEFIEKKLAEQGVKCISIESGDIDKTKALIDEYRPKVIFTETVGNNLSMPITDIDALVDKVEQTNEKYKEHLGLTQVLQKQLSHKKWIRNWLGLEPLEELNQEQEEKLLALVDKFEETSREVNQKHSYLPLRELVKTLGAQNITQGMDQRTILLELKSLIDTAWLAKRENPVTLILDNTLSAGGFDLVKKVNESNAPILAIESGTKFYALDKGTFGLLYSNSSEQITELKIKRAMTGSYLPPAVEAVLPERNKEDFDVRNKQILSNTKALAQSFAKMTDRDDLGIKSVSHPNLPTHPNYKYTSENMPEGGTAVFYLVCEDAWKVAKKLQDKLGKRIEFGASFAFEKTRVGVFNDNLLRIAGGNESPEEIQEMLEAIESI